MKPLIHPYGGTLINLLSGDAGALQQEAMHLPTLDLNAQAAADVELLVSGAFSPLKGLMGRTDYESVLAQNSLADGRYWPVPITLEVPAHRLAALQNERAIALRDAEGLLLGVLRIAEL
ncbi:MAG TPA: hypothetical protein VJM53_09785, partial [Burkholderiales bacterium]|nr:hypothetical protein [Burkholderiales bacterium]